MSGGRGAGSGRSQSSANNAAILDDLDACLRESEVRCDLFLISAILDTFLLVSLSLSLSIGVWQHVSKAHTATPVKDIPSLTWGCTAHAWHTLHFSTS